MSADSQGRLDEEIARLRERLESAEEMRRAIVADQIDGFVVGDDPQRVVLLEASVMPQALIEHLPHSVVTISRNADVLYANRRFGEVVGRPLGRLFSTSMLDLVGEHHRPAFRRFLATSEPGSTLRVELEHANGARIAARVTTMAVSDGYTSLLIDEEVPHDGDEAAYAVQAIASGNIDGVVVGGERVMLLAEAQRPYRALVDRMQEGAATISPEGDVLYANERFATMVGAPREALLGKRLRTVLGTPAVDALLISEAASPIEFPLMRGDGSLLPVRIAVERVDGIDAMTLIVEDLTERDRHRAIQERAQRNDHFLAVLAHELRNPLGSIRNAAEILRRSGLAQGERAALGVIERQSETLARLVDDLLDVHRLNEGKMVLQRKPVEVRAAIDDAVGAVAQNLKTKSQTIDVRLPEEPLHVHADPVRIAQVLGNLLLNASKFTANGGHIDVVVERGERDATPIARIRVTDNGIGVASDQLERIFEPYVQASAETSRFPEGLGLGLSVARRLIELHEGTIRAQSDGPGRGSTFVVELPLCDAPGAAPAPAADRFTRRARILIADDDRDSASTLSSLLELMGHESHTAHDGQATIATADAVRPDVVILDIRMPQVDGYAAARTLRQRPWARGLVLYALTGWGEARDRERTREAGFDRHFVKPVSIDELLSHLADDLQRPRTYERDPSDAEAEPGD
jgi:PAS domain S-box-containing protein